MSKIYVVQREGRREGDGKVIYAGEEPTEAKRVADEARVPRRHPDSRETFIHVWEDGEHQYVTRENPKSR